MVGSSLQIRLDFIMTTDDQHAMSKVDLKSYAGSTRKSPYDALARYNLEYQRLLVEVEGIFSAHAVTCSRVLDLGCGSGNFTLAIGRGLRANPSLQIVASDISVDMLEVFRSKIDAQLVARISLKQADALDTTAYAEGSFDAVNIIHALNYTGKPQQTLANISRWLKPGGILVAVDIGRPLVVANWRKGIWGWAVRAMRRRGFVGPLAWIPTLSLFLRYSAAGKENEKFAIGQREGRYPMHSTVEFQSWVKETGFEILRTSTDFYRDPVTGEGIDDLIVARKV